MLKKNLWVYVLIIFACMVIALLYHSRKPPFVAYPLSESLLYHPDLANVEMVLCDVVINYHRRYGVYRVLATIINNTEHVLSYSHLFTLEFFDGENWRVSPRHMMPDLIPGDLPVIWENEVQNWTFDLDDFYPFPSVDLFRVRRRFSIVTLYEDWSDTRDIHDLVLEFSFD